MKLVMIRYNAGNVCSVENALARIGATATLSDDSEVIRSADKIIFPGVGHAASAMASLKEKQLDKLLPSLSQPVLGICVGMQLLCRWSEEGNTDCLGIFPLKVMRFSDPHLKVPQTGWNQIHSLKSPLFRGVAEHEYVYNVHSYYVEKGDHCIAACEYGVDYAAAIHRENFFGVQFHTEKSGKTGDTILKNFLEL